ncbi:tandem-95 repeat protein [Paracoccus stylophorae]|uniref:Tandem-95 repeat protein n=1 Tax=Paracoccus stylophorae TaxID=659350 RepID=A0ABY7SYI7_9RHOB|nr:Ig-like domain-containing protein [Paracoccus stylophorae]WCR12089.1 tandem-95 repeat protein [Paracoccus stylophorae]
MTTSNTGGAGASHYETGLLGEFFKGGSFRSLFDALDRMQGRADAVFVSDGIDYEQMGGTLRDFLGADADTLSDADAAEVEDQFALRLSGEVYLEAGSHRFYAMTDDGFRLTIDGQVVTEYEGARASDVSQGTIRIAESGWYSINVDYFEAWGHSELRVGHSVNGGPLGYIDEGALRHSVGTDVEEPSNAAPQANDDGGLTVAAGQVLTIRIADLLANDSDADGDALSLVRLTDVTNGTAEIVGDEIRFAAGAEGSGGFRYAVSDGQGGRDSANVSIAVTDAGDPPTEPAPNAAPRARNDQRTMEQGGTLRIDALANDSDPDGDTLTISRLGRAEHGSVRLNDDGTVTYVPDAGFSGQDSFVYTASDGNGGRNSARVTIDVNGGNMSPEAVDDGGFSAIEGQALIIPIADLLANDSDPDGGSLSIERLTNVQNGTAQIVGDQIRFTGDDDGAASFDYVLSDGQGGTARATVSLEVTEAEDDGDDDQEPGPGPDTGGSDGEGGDGGHGHGSFEPIDPPQTPAEIARFVETVMNMPEAEMSGPPEAMAGHMAALNLVDRGESTHVAVSHGDWNDASTWHNGEIPGEGARVLIPEGISVGYSAENDASIFTVRVDGELHFATDQDSRLLVDTLVVSPTGRLEIGTADHPVEAGTNVDIVFADNGDINVGWDQALLSRGMIAFGEVDIAGQEKSSHLKVQVDAMAGDTALTLAEEPSGWQVGDKLVLTGTYQQGFYWNNDTRAMDFAESQDEEVTITAIDGNTVTLNRPLIFDHDTPRDDLKAYVANMTRNVTFSSEGGDDLPVHQRGHVMFMHNDDVDVRYAGFDDLGRTDKAEFAGPPSAFGGVGNLSPDTNLEARYPFHIHEAGLDDIENPAIAIGNVVDGSPGWGFVQHSSNANLTNNVAFDAWGAAFVAEDGNETGTWLRNIAIKSQGWSYGDWAVKESPIDGNSARTGDGFWFGGRLVEAAENVAANTTNGFVWLQRGDRDNIDPATTHRPEIGYGQDELRPDKHPIQGFRDNEAFGTNTGLIVVKASPDQGHDVRSVFDGFLNWETREGAAVSYTSHYTFLDFDLVGQRPESGLGWDYAYHGVTLGTNAIDMVFNGIRIEGFDHAFNLADNIDVETRRAGDFHNTVIDGDFRNIRNEDIRQEFDGQLQLLQGSDLTEGRMQFRLTADRIISDADHMFFNGIKTDSIGEIERSFVLEEQGLWGWDKEHYLNTNGFWRLPDGTPVALVEDFVADRATGELTKQMLVFELDYSDRGLESRYPFNGVVDLGGPAVTARDDSATTMMNTDIRIDLTANDSDPDGGRVVVNGLVNPVHGDVFMQDDGTVLYRPNEGFTGVDRFSYWAADEEGNFSRADAVVTVEPGNDLLHQAMQSDMFDL